MNTDMIPKAKVLRKTTGMLKAVIDKDSGKILGAALFCPESYEIINMVKLTMDYDWITRCSVILSTRIPPCPKG